MIFSSPSLELRLKLRAMWKSVKGRVSNLVKVSQRHRARERNSKNAFLMINCVQQHHHHGNPDTSKYLTIPMCEK